MMTMEEQRAYRLKQVLEGLKPRKKRERKPKPGPKLTELGKVGLDEELKTVPRTVPAPKPSSVLGLKAKAPAAAKKAAPSKPKPAGKPKAKAEKQPAKTKKKEAGT